jgi:tRNA-Thr(GGU) m(6)t(6)A37 methyltransferase TsaA
MNSATSTLKPIGVVSNQNHQQDTPYSSYLPSKLVLEPQYEPALKNLTQNSHIWVICLFEQRENSKMQTRPMQINPNLDSFGVLALRSPNHPNPLALTLAKLIKVEGSTVYLEGLDAFDGTPVVDIKPYLERDSIFSPRLPDIRHANPLRRQNHLLTIALNHHQEACAGLALAVRIIGWLEQYYQINPLDEQLLLQITGNACLADSLQGLCRARLANPPRFAYQAAEISSCHFQTPQFSCRLNIKPASFESEFAELLTAPIEELIDIL